MMNDWAQFTFFFTGPELQPGEEIPPYPPQRVYNNSNSLKVQCSFPESQDHTLNVIPYEASQTQDNFIASPRYQNGATRFGIWPAKSWGCFGPIIPCCALILCHCIF